MLQHDNYAFNMLNYAFNIYAMLQHDNYAFNTYMPCSNTIIMLLTLIGHAPTR